MIHKHLSAISCLELVKDGTAHLFQQKLSLGVIQQLRGQNFAIFDPPLPAWTVFIPLAWTKTDIF